MSNKEHAQHKPGRRWFLRSLAAITTLAALDRRELTGDPPLIIPEYVHAQAGNEGPIYDARGQEIGYFYTQTGDGETRGFSVIDNGVGNFWSAFQRLGGVEVLGYPISRVFEKDGLQHQLFQGGALQVNPQHGHPDDGIALANAFDILSTLEKKNQNLAANFRSRGIPAHDVSGQSLDQLLARLDPQHYPDLRAQTAAQALQATFDEQGMQIYGVPTSEIVDYGLYSAIRLQRIGFQYWQEEVPGHPELPKPGTVTSFLAGDLLKEVGWVDDVSVLEPEVFAIGGAPEVGEPNAVEAFLAQTEIIDTASAEVDGILYTVTTRKTPTAQYQARINPETQETLLREVIARDGKKNNFTHAQVVVAGSIDPSIDLSERRRVYVEENLAYRTVYSEELEAVPLLPGKTGIPGPVFLNLPVVTSGRLDGFLQTYFFTAHRRDTTVTLFIAPYKDLPLTDQDIGPTVDQSISLTFIVMLMSGYDPTDNVARKDFRFSPVNTELGGFQAARPAFHLERIQS